MFTILNKVCVCSMVAVAAFYMLILANMAVTNFLADLHKTLG
jgi:hypothetical protein